MAKLIIILIFFIQLFNLSLEKTIKHFKQNNSLNLNQFKGVYSISNDCSNIWCPNTRYLDYQPGQKFSCPQSGNTANITYSEQQNYYQFTFELYTTFFQGDRQEIYFDNSNVFNDTEIHIPLLEGYNMIMAPYWRNETYKIFEKCDDDKTKNQWVVWKTSKIWEEPNSCSFIIEKYGQLLNQKEKQTNYRTFTYKYTTEELVGSYEIGTQCKKCQNTFIDQQFTQQQLSEFATSFKCPLAKSIATIIYDDQLEIFNLKFKNDTYIENSSNQQQKQVLLQFSKLNFIDHNFIRIPLRDSSGNQNQMTIYPCFIQGLKTSEACSDNQNQIQLSVEKYQDDPWTVEPCYFIMTKQNNQEKKNKKKQ